MDLAGLESALIAQLKKTSQVRAQSLHPHFIWTTRVDGRYLDVVLESNTDPTTKWYFVLDTIDMVTKREMEAVKQEPTDILKMIGVSLVSQGGPNDVPFFERSDALFFDVETLVFWMEKIVLE